MSDLSEFTEKHIRDIRGGKRCAVVWTPWMGDWFASHSPRNSNSNAEGPWDHWVQLAVSILQHPATKVVRPDAHAAVEGLTNTHFYDETARPLSDEEVETLFGGEQR